MMIYIDLEGHAGESKTTISKGYPLCASKEFDIAKEIQEAYFDKPHSINISKKSIKMKRFAISLAIAVALLCSFSFEEAHAQGFNSVTTPDGVNLIAVGNSGKLYRSANGGTTWTSIPNGSVNMNSVSSFGNDVWIAANGGAVYKTQKTISPLTLYSAGTSENLKSIVFVSSGTGFACGTNGTVVKSTDGGLTWFSSNSGIGSVQLNSISFSDANNGIAVGNGGVMYTTVNGGSTWGSVSSGTTRNLLKAKYFADGIAVAGEYGTLLMYNGSWTTVNTKTKTDITGVTGTGIGNVHVCGGGGFIRNNSGGSTKFLNFETNPMMANLVDIFYYDANNAWAVSSLNGVIIYTTNGGTSWSMPAGATVSLSWVQKLSASGGIGNNLCEHPFDRNTMFVVYGSTVYVSRNRGENWTNIATISGGGNAHSFYVSPLDTNIWMVAITGSPDKVKRSTNYGANWTDVVSRNFSNYGQPLEMDQNDPSRYYFAPDGGGFYRSTDNGATFTEISGNYPFRSPCDVLVMWDSSDVVFVADGVTGSGLAEVFKSVDNGVSWFRVHTNASSSEIPSMCNTAFDKSTFWATNWSGGQYYRTTTFGDTWYLHSTQATSGWGSDYCHEDPTMLLKGTYGSPTYLTTNSGANFISTSVGGGAGAGIIVTERGYMLNMQTGGLFKMNIVYNDVTVVAQVDVQALSLGSLGTAYFETATISPTGTVKNNNGVASATFTVTRRINPGNYVSTKNVSNLAPSGTANVTFDPWTFQSGTAYTVKDSVYIASDEVPSNDVLSGTLTPYVGAIVTKLDQQFSTVTYPPTGWSTSGSGTMRWMYDPVSSYGNGTGSSKYDFWNSSSGTSQSLATSTFTATTAGDSLTYDYAYSPYSGTTDSIIIETSTNGGSSYSALVRLYGNTSASGQYSLNTAPAQGTAFTPNSGQWLSKSWGLPVGTNRVRFRARSGFGNNFFVDNITIESGSLYTQMNVKLAPEGFLNGSTLNLRDTVRVYLRNNNSPFAVVDSSVAVFDSLTFTAPCVFKYANSGTYYVQVLHRNALETWSRNGGESVTRGVFSLYDFTSAQSQAYGSNMVQSGGYWLFYSGDVNGDGSIDGSDLVAIDNDAFNFEFGYRSTDVNGDGTIDGTDLAVTDNNASNFISKVTPGTSPGDIEAFKVKIKAANYEYRKSAKVNELKQNTGRSK